MAGQTELHGFNGPSFKPWPRSSPPPDRHPQAPGRGWRPAFLVDGISRTDHASRSACHDNGTPPNAFPLHASVRLNPLKIRLKSEVRVADDVAQQATRWQQRLWTNLSA